MEYRTQGIRNRKMTKRRPRVQLPRGERRSQLILEQGDRKKVLMENGSAMFKILKNNINRCVEIVGAFGEN